MALSILFFWGGGGGGGGEWSALHSSFTLLQQKTMHMKI